MIKRKLLNNLIDHLSKKEITMIVGPRQAGKTTVMQLMMGEVKKKRQKALFLNLDFDEERQFFSSQLKLLKKIELEIGKKGGFVFIDEIQRLDDAGLFLKGLYDRNLPYKFIVSGSGSVELKEKIHESLAGRKQIFELSTLSFEEFVNYKTNYRYQEKLNLLFELEPEKTDVFLEEYLNLGGYPRVVIAENLTEKRMVIDEIYQSYIMRDIGYLLQVQKIDSYSKLIRALAAQIGNSVSYNELAKTVGISLPTVSNYLWYGEKTFILRKLTPFFSNPRKEITKSPLYYFYDLGFRNYALGLFGQLSRKDDYGFIFENMVLNIILDNIRYTGATVHYWRTKDGAEVDFVINYGDRLLPIEVKYKRLEKPYISRSFNNFIVKYKPSDAILVNLSIEIEENIGDTRVNYIPFYRLPEILALPEV